MVADEHPMPILAHMITYEHPMPNNHAPRRLFHPPRVIAPARQAPPGVRGAGGGEGLRRPARGSVAASAAAGDTVADVAVVAVEIVVATAVTVRAVVHVACQVYCFGCMNGV